jgi:hypothetical protein
MKSVVLLAFVVFTAGCVSTPTETSNQATNEGAGSTTTTLGVVQTAAWKDTELLDVNSGETYKISDFEGKVVILETMAVWCSLCKQQQLEIRKAEQGFGEDVVSVSLDIDPNENINQLLAHAQSNGFNWRYSVAPREMAIELSQVFNSNVLNPTATPVIILDKKQQPHLLRFGIKGSSELITEISKYT